jgi:hypothetical protein
MDMMGVRIRTIEEELQPGLHFVLDWEQNFATKNFLREQ